MPFRLIELILTVISYYDGINTTKSILTMIFTSLSPESYSIKKTVLLLFVYISVICVAMYKKVLVILLIAPIFELCLLILSGIIIGIRFLL
jgi:hypothetical protein